MANTGVKVSALPTAANAASTDRVLILRDPSGTPSVRTITVSDLSANLLISNSVPANSTANGVTGYVAIDTSYIYVCVANNTWKRAALTTW